MNCLHKLIILIHPSSKAQKAVWSFNKRSTRERSKRGKRETKRESGNFWPCGSSICVSIITQVSNSWELLITYKWTRSSQWKLALKASWATHLSWRMILRKGIYKLAEKEKEVSIWVTSKQEKVGSFWRIQPELLYVIGPLKNVNKMLH